MKMMKPKKNDLRIWHIPQVPGKGFKVPVASVDEGRLLLGILAEYDMFQLAANIKPDYTNASGLEVFDGKEWIEWENEEGEHEHDAPLPKAIDATLQTVRATSEAVIGAATFRAAMQG